MIERRLLLKSALGLALPSVVAAPAMAAAPARRLSLLNLHTGERLAATYWEAGGYVPDAMEALSKVLRDHRTGEAHPIDPKLFDLVDRLSGRLETQQTVQVISGYRSPRTNAALHKASSGVATKSLHMQGMAMDLRIAGVDLARLRDAALSLQGGGVGYYPESNFVHVDVGRVRRW
jgi:uncharacterized protein YcbK (DUF882 family)